MPTRPASRAPAASEPNRTILPFAQAIHILRANETITRADARAWINAEFPNAGLVLESAISKTPEDPPPADGLDFTTVDPDPHHDLADEEPS